jgi:hypothetical protein
MTDMLTLAVELGEKSFPFRLCRRKLNFGPAGEACYFWMDSRPFRSRRLGDNYRLCVDHWWAAVEAEGASGEMENEVTLVLAECYPLVSTARSLQDIYVDAHLHKRADREFTVQDDNGRKRIERSYSLPTEEAARLRRLAARRDTRLIRAELEALFLGELPPNAELAAYQHAAEAWLGDGILALRRNGRPAASACC